MKSMVYSIRCGLCVVALFATNLAFSADVKTYQVTGPVIEVTPTTITVQKGDENWQIARDKNTKATGDIKVGTKVTVYYKMTAAEIEVKEAAKAPKEKK
jgi:LysM repeat protein